MDEVNGEPCEVNDSEQSQTKDHGETDENSANNLLAIANDSNAVTDTNNSNSSRIGGVLDLIIDKTEASQSPQLDLSYKGLDCIPRGVLKLTHLQYLYLSDNDLEMLPDMFFNDLPNLVWLDLRWNSLKALPIAYIGRLASLETLLLQGNRLRTLPLELGLVISLNELNLADNPLEFPPEDVIARGVQGILSFLREMLKAKVLGETLPVKRIEQTLGGIRDSDSDDELDDSRILLTNRSAPQTLSKHSQFLDMSSKQASTLSGQELMGPTHRPISLQQRQVLPRPATRKKSGEKGQRSRLPVQNKRKKKPFQMESRIPLDKAEQKFLENMHKEKVKEIKMRQDMILQKRRDAEKLKEFQQKTKDLQQAKMREKIMNGGFIDFDQPSEHAPFGVDKTHMRVPTNKERMEYDPKEHDRIRHRPLSPASQQRLEEARLQREVELHKRLKEHQKNVADRKGRPDGQPTQQMEAALKELHMAEELHREIEQRRKELEYRFTAFTGGDVTLPKSKN